MTELSSALSLPNNLELDELRIDIWQFSLLTYPENALELLDEEERERAQRFHFERHRRRFIAAHAAMRLILGRYLQCTAASIQFVRQHYGKPAIANSLGLEFNLSHSEEIGILAVGKRFPLGADVECFSSRSLHGLVKHAFSPSEIDDFFKLSEALQPLAFFHIWSQKEAFIKASGLGLHYPTQQFSVPVLSQSKHLIFDELHQKKWALYSFMPQVRCYAALCYEPVVSELRYFRVRHLVEFNG